MPELNGEVDVSRLPVPEGPAPGAPTVCVQALLALCGVCNAPMMLPRLPSGWFLSFWFDGTADRMTPHRSGCDPNNSAMWSRARPGVMP